MVSLVTLIIMGVRVKFDRNAFSDLLTEYTIITLLTCKMIFSKSILVNRSAIVLYSYLAMHLSSKSTW